MRHLLLALLILLRPLAAADPPDKIIAQHVAALGGAKALKARDTVEYRGEASDAAGERASFTLAIRAPNLIYLEMAASKGGWSEADNGKSAWRRDSVQGLRTLSGVESKQLRTLAYFLNAGFVDYKKDKWSAAGVAGAIEMTNAASELAGARAKFYFDPATHLLVKQEQPDGDSMTFGDYRPVNGIREPFHMVLHRGTQTYDVTFTGIVSNKQLDPHTFDYPGAAISNAPEMGKLLEDLSKHQSDMRSVRRQYSCTLDEVSEDVNGKGQVSKTANERYYVFYLGNHEFRKHVATNGLPLSATEMKKEEERLAKEQKQWEGAANRRRLPARQQRLKRVPSSLLNKTTGTPI